LHHQNPSKNLRKFSYNQWIYSEKDEVMHNVVWKERIRDEVLNWRANNLGMLGFFFSGGGPRMDLRYLEYHAPVTGFLAGTKGKPTLKTHLFTPGETLERGALLLNNSHRPDQLTCECKFELDGKTVAEWSKTETIPAGGQVFVPISVKLPEGGAPQSALFHAGGSRDAEDDPGATLVLRGDERELGAVAQWLMAAENHRPNWSAIPAALNIRSEPAFAIGKCSMRCWPEPPWHDRLKPLPSLRTRPSTSRTTTWCGDSCRPVWWRAPTKLSTRWQPTWSAGPMYLWE
jgi:hypothetical protein